MSAAAASTAKAAAGSPPPQPCAHVAASPAFARDRTVFCAGTVTTDGLTPAGLGIVVSTNGGRTWRKASASGLPQDKGVVIDGLLVSPRYANDRTVVVNVRLHGLYQSSDGGESFTPLLPASVRGVTAFVGGMSAAGGDAVAARTMLLVPSGAAQLPLVVDTATRTAQPVPGAPAVAVGAVVSPAWATDGTALLFTDAGTSGAVTAYGCNVAFDCRTRLGRLPAGYTFEQAWPAADFTTSKTLFVKARSGSGRSRLYVSRDGGSSFTAMSEANRLLDAHVERPSRDPHPVASIATGRPGSARVWMRVYGSPHASLPAAELYRSDDNGRRWTRVAYGRIAQKGPRGTMQDVRVPPGQFNSLIAATPDDVVFVNGIARGGWTASCSNDRGRTWSTFCR